MKGHTCDDMIEDMDKSLDELEAELKKIESTYI